MRQCECEVQPKLVAFFAALQHRLQADDADALNSILHSPVVPFVVTPTFFLEVDRSRLNDSMEAWLHVTIVACPDEYMTGYQQYRDGTYAWVTTLSGRAWTPADQPELGDKTILYPFSGFGRASAILTWPNSD